MLWQALKKNRKKVFFFFPHFLPLNLLLLSTISLSLSLSQTSTYLYTLRSHTLILHRRKLASSLRSKYGYLSPELSVDHLVIGGGVVGLAIGERLVKAFPNRTTFLIERHEQIGQETSSRNSEVIHSGLYYPLHSLKAKLCIKGRDMLYSRCSKNEISFKKTGKLILATTPTQLNYLESLIKRSKELKEAGIGNAPLTSLTGDEVRDLEPDVGKGVIAALLSTETGIIDSHSLMTSLEKEIEDSEQGQIVLGTKVVRIDRMVGTGGKRGDGSEEGWVIQSVSGEDEFGNGGERSAVLAKVVINAAGLNAHNVANQIKPKSKQLYFAKGSYYSYRGPGTSSISRLLYPCPAASTSLAGLGTHLTLSLSGEVRFGPNVEWLKAPLIDVGDGEGGMGKEEEADFWMKHLAVSESEELKELFVKSVKEWLPGVVAEGFSPDYAGIRPKLSAPDTPAADFSISHSSSSGERGFINLLGIESPGLTSSLAIGQMVEGIVRREIWGLGSKGSGRGVSEAGRGQKGEVETMEAWA